MSKIKEDTSRVTIDKTLDWVRLSEIKSADRNPKGHDYDALDESLERFGFQGSVIIDGMSTKLVAGHGRIEALRRRFNKGGVPPRGIEIDDHDGDWLVPAMRGYFKDELDAEAYLIADNRLTELGAWDDVAALSEMLADLVDEDSIFGTGFTEDDLAEIVKSLETVAPPSSSSGDATQIGSRYEVVVECEDEHDMEVVYKQLTAEGRTCRSLIL